MSRLVVPAMAGYAFANPPYVPDAFRGRLLICDTTTWSSTAGGVDSLQRFWRNVVQLKRAAE